ncbi:flavodoxin-like fold family protein [Asticcacaulis biprosthecium C19]|uniref:Flavodoxin-like fold family protein n=1 Tax=Asticcacaulis biprosthecium C19 TaxID=715226 RepID=F4QTC2_9CAUL|nr:NAD(P)H-dependent oxidoreductase [Asticcacaulis biprosthecium]EGF89992.1 flavodoxin-like fold family protein [Asticcacaulis biprosthecium C19]
MTERILIINGNPARNRRSFSEVLACAYNEGALSSGHEVRMVKLADLDFDPILHEGYHAVQVVEPDLADVQASIQWASHIVFVYPMWQFNVPALVKGFCERAFTPGFAYRTDAKNPLDAPLLKGRSVRLIQTMGMPGAVYWLAFRAHGGKAFKNLFGFCGFKPVRLSTLGLVEEGPETRQNHIAGVENLGRKGA